MFCLRLKSRFISHIFQFVSENDLCSQRHNRNACYFTDVRYGTAGTWVYFDNIYFFTAYNKLNVDHTDYMKCFCQTACVLCNRVFCFLADCLCRIYGDTVSGMDTCTFDMFHDTRNQDILTITYSIDLDFFTHQVFINKDRMFLCDLVDDSDIFFYILIADRNTHTLSAKNVGRTYKYRISQLIGCFFCFFGSKDSMSLRSRNLALLQNFIEQLTVFSRIYIFCRCSEDFYSHFHECFGKFDCSLSTELYNCTIRFLNIYDVFHIFRCQ